MARVTTIIASVLFVLALPLALAFGNFRLFVLDPANFISGQQRYGVSAATGIGASDLAAIDRAMVRYFQSDRDSFQEMMESEGVARSPFSERDIAHLQDVYDLISRVIQVQSLSMIFAAIFILVALITGKWRLVARSVFAGSVLTVGLLGLLGLLSLFDWDTLFLKFHFVSFSNDLWRLDPQRDALIRLYPPPGFYLDATLRIVGMSLGQSFLLGALTFLLLKLSPSGKRRLA